VPTKAEHWEENLLQKYYVALFHEKFHDKAIQMGNDHELESRFTEQELKACNVKKLDGYCKSVLQKALP